MVYAIFSFPAAKKEGMGWAIKQGADWGKMALATVISLMIALALFSWWGAVLLAAICLLILLFSKYLCSRFGGLTGDNYGAINEFAEVAVLFLIFIIGKLGGASWLSAFL